MRENKEETAANVAFSWPRFPLQPPNPPPSDPTPEQMVLSEQMRGDHTRGSRAVGLGWGTPCGLNKAKNSKVVPSHLPLEVGVNTLSTSFIVVPGRRAMDGQKRARVPWTQSSGHLSCHRQCQWSYAVHNLDGCIWQSCWTYPRPSFLRTGWWRGH